MLQPKKTKFRKMQKGKMKGNAQRGHQLSFGSYGIKALEEVWICRGEIYGKPDLMAHFKAPKKKAGSGGGKPNNRRRQFLELRIELRNVTTKENKIQKDAEGQDERKCPKR